MVGIGRPPIGSGRSDHLPAPSSPPRSTTSSFVRGEPDLTRKHLAEAQQIAERGPMPRFLAAARLIRTRLIRTRLFHDPAELAAAARLIRTLGYGRRFQELADAEAALPGS